MTFLVDVSGSMANHCKEGNQNRLEAALEGGNDFREGVEAF